MSDILKILLLEKKQLISKLTTIRELIKKYEAQTDVDLTAISKKLNLNAAKKDYDVLTDIKSILIKFNRPLPQPILVEEFKKLHPEVSVFYSRSKVATCLRYNCLTKKYLTSIDSKRGKYYGLVTWTNMQVKDEYLKKDLKISKNMVFHVQDDLVKVFDKAQKPLTVADVAKEMSKMKKIKISNLVITNALNNLKTRGSSPIIKLEKNVINNPSNTRYFRYALKHWVDENNNIKKKFDKVKK